MSFYPNAFNLVLVLLRRYYSSSVCFKRSIFLLKPRQRLYSFVEIIKSNIPKIEFVIFIASEIWKRLHIMIHFAKLSPSFQLRWALIPAFPHPPTTQPPPTYPPTGKSSGKLKLKPLHLPHLETRCMITKGKLKVAGDISHFKHNLSSYVRNNVSLVSAAEAANLI